MLHVAILVFAVWACSTAVILINMCDISPVPLAGYRQVIASLVLLPLFLRDLQKHKGRFTPTHVKRTILPGLLLGAHFITWIMGCRETAVANASLIVNMVPVVMPFLLYMLMREKLNRGEFFATALAFAGMAVMAIADYQFRPDYFNGDVLCLISMVFLAGYLTLGRRNRDFPTVWLYLTPLYMFGGIVCLAAAPFFPGTYAITSLNNLIVMFAIAIVPTVFGHSLLNYSMRHFRGQIVGISNLGEFVFASITAWLLWKEAPENSFYIAAPLVVAGGIMAMKSMPDTPSEDLRTHSD